MADVTRYVVSGLATGLADGTSLENAWPSFTAAAAGLASEYSSDLVSADVNVTVECSNPNNVADVCNSVSFDFVMDATRALHFTNSNPSVLYELTSSSSLDDSIVQFSNTNASVVTFARGFYFHRDMNGGTRRIIRGKRSAVRVDGCRFKCDLRQNTSISTGINQDLSNNAMAGSVTNCVFEGEFAQAIWLNDYRTDYKSLNNTFIGSVLAINAQNSDIKSRNDVFQNCTTDIQDANGGSDVDYMLTDGTATGANSVGSTTLTFTDAANGDYSLAAGDTAAVGVGIGPSADADIPTTDALGGTRSGATTDLGAYLAAAAQTYTIDSIDGDNDVQAGQSNVDIVMSVS